MAKRRHSASHQQKQLFDSGATGGPGTARGVKYQLKFAVYQTLELISRLLTSSPVQRPLIWLEPRTTTSNTITRWDIRVSPDETVTEAKVNPSKADILGWLESVVAAAKDRRLQFQLVYGERTAILKSLEALVRLATEAGGNEQQFSDLLGFESIRHKDQLLPKLSPRPAALLRRLKLWLFDETALERDIDLRLSHLTRPADRQRLHDYLFRRFTESMVTRSAIFVSSLMNAVEQEGISLHRPPAIEPIDLPRPLHSMLFTLEHCVAPVPPDVLAATCQVPRKQLEQYAATLLENGSLSEEDGLWRSKVRSGLTHSDGPTVLADSLKCLIEFIKANKTNDAGIGQVPNAISLARACAADRPDAAVAVFKPLQGLLKRKGDKKLVLEIARLVIQAASRPTGRTETDVHAEAEARICGLAWVFQRIDRLDEANTEATKSLELGQSVGYDRNTAFCFKCIGRLRRIQSERSENVRQRNRLLAESVEYLQKAIRCFSGNSAEYGPDSDEVGDCYSLLGRTYLTMGELAQAEAAANDGAVRILDPASKDYMDLLILRGDLSSEKFNWEQADKLYGQALELVGTNDAEHSEIAARALFQRGMNLHKWRRDGWRDCLERAAGIWNDLDDHFRAKEAEWQVHLLDGHVPLRQRARLMKEHPGVRVEAIRLHHSALASQASRALAQRADVPDAVWERHIASARANHSVAYREW